jgi:hypothetical protein
MCYTGNPLAEVFPGSFGIVSVPEGGNLVISAVPAVASCPLPGFTKTSSITPGPSGTHSLSHPQCKSTHKAWAKKHRHVTRAQKKAEANNRVSGASLV